MSFGFYISFGTVSPFTTKLILCYLKLFTDVKWKKVTTGGKKSVEHSQREEKDSMGFLKSAKAPSQNSAQLDDAKAARHALDS